MSNPNGYRRIDSPDILFPWEFADRGFNIYYYPEVSSTMDTAKELARKNCPDFTLDEFEKRLQKVEFENVISEWKKYTVTLNRQVKLVTHQEVSEGLAVDVEQDGALVLELADGTRKKKLYTEIASTKNELCQPTSNDGVCLTAGGLNGSRCIPFHSHWPGTHRFAEYVRLSGRSSAGEPVGARQRCRISAERRMRSAGFCRWYWWNWTDRGAYRRLFNRLSSGRFHCRIHFRKGRPANRV